MRGNFERRRSLDLAVAWIRDWGVGWEEGRRRTVRVARLVFLARVRRWVGIVVVQLGICSGVRIWCGVVWGFEGCDESNSMQFES